MPLRPSLSASARAESIAVREVEQPAYRVDVGDAVADRDRILALWQLCSFGGTATENATRYDWFYLQNPQGRGRVYLLRASGSQEILGAVGVGARDFVAGSDGGKSPSGTLVDFVVHPGHRSLFPALLLQRTVCEQEFRRCGFVYGLPLAKAVPVVARLHGATRFTSGTYVRVIRSANYIRKNAPWLPSPLVNLLGASIDMLRSAHIWLSLRFSRTRCVATGGYPDLDACLRRIASAEGLTIGDRSPEIMAWRGRPAQRKFETLSFQDRRSGETIGYIMYAVDSDSLSVIDFIVPRNDGQARSIWLDVCRKASALRAAVVRVEFGGCERVPLQLRSAGYFHRGSRPGFVILREPAAATAANWWFTRFDEDV